MANLSSVVPYHDPYEYSIEDEYLNFITDPEPVPLFENLSQTQVADSQTVQDYYDSMDQKHHEAGPSSSSWKGKESACPTNLDDTMPVHVPVWPPDPVPFQCSCCQILREIIHTDGFCTTKLEIHGRLGLISHAILETRDHLNAINSKPEYHMFDFCKKSLHNVKRFLHTYCDDRKNSGFVILQDPFTVFYEALCIGIESNQNSSSDDLHDGSPTDSSGGWNQRQADQTEGENEAEKPKSLLALQRERAGKLTLKDLEPYFHLPIEEAAKKMNLCPTVVKKICRREGMARWPHRKLKSLQRQISKLKSTLNPKNAEEKERVESEIMRLEEDIMNICSVANH